MPSKRETLTVVVIMALFLLLTGIFIGLRSEHLLMAVLYLVLFFAGLPTRKLAVALLPFAIFGISYDWMRICPNYEVNPIDVAGLYHLEKSLFGVMDTIQFICLNGTSRLQILDLVFFCQLAVIMSQRTASLFHIKKHMVQIIPSDTVNRHRCHQEDLWRLVIDSRI